MEKIRVDFNKHPEQKEKYLSMTEEEQIEQAKNLFSYTLHNEWTAALES